MVGEFKSLFHCLNGSKIFSCIFNFIRTAYFTIFDLKFYNQLKSYLSLDEILTFDWRVALGDMLITEEEFKALSKNAGKLIRIKDSYALMTEDEIKKIIKSLSSTRDISSLKLLQSVLSEEYDGARVEIDDELKKEIQKLMQENKIPLPNDLQATLHPYQQRGIKTPALASVHYLPMIWDSGRLCR